MYHRNSISVLCLVLISLGAALIAFKANIHYKGFRNLIVLKPGTSLFKKWTKSEGVNFDIYIFNWTNPEEFTNRSTKPILAEIGPFRFKQTMEKINTTFNRNGTMSYFRKRTFYFARDESAHDLDFNVTVPNTVAVALADKAKDWSFFFKKSLSYSLRTLLDNKIYVTKTAKELLFDGYHDPILDLAQKFSTSAPEKFGFFFGKNASAKYDGIFSVSLGGDSPLGQISEWNYKTSTDAYVGNCTKFAGSVGDFFPRKRREDTLKLFHPDVCRSMIADYVGNKTVNGLHGWEYVMADHFLDNGTLIPGNECTCGENCLPYGAVYATACKTKTPNYLSLPHFYRADSSFGEKVIGLKPDPEKHEFYIVYEPNTGLPLAITPRLQINVLIRPVSYISMFENVPSTLFPVVWFEQRAGMPPLSAFIVRIILNMNGICLVLGLSLILIGISTFLFLVYRIRSVRPKEHHHSKNYLPKELVPLKEKDAPSC